MKAILSYIAFWASILGLGVLLGLALEGVMLNTYTYIGIIIAFSVVLGVATHDAEENEEDETI